MHTQRQEARWGVRRCRHARVGGNTVENGGVRGVELRRGAWFDCSAGGGEPQRVGGVA